MITVQFFADGERLEEIEMPAAPRVGETITTKSPFRTFEVERVVYNDEDAEAVARVYLIETRHFFES